MKFPCKDCAERKTGCHSTCENYLLARTERDNALETKWQIDRSYDYHNDSVTKNRIKRIKDQAKR